MHVFRFFEGLLEPTAIPTETAPPAGLGAFYWHYARQARHLVAALFAAGFIVAILDTTIPVFIGRVVTLVSAHAPGSLLHDNWPQLLGMASILLVARPAALLLQNLITNQGIIPGFSNLIRWQSHWHVVRQSWAFFQNDFAGRIAQRVMQTGPSLRESVVSATNAVWYILVYGAGAISADGVERCPTDDPGAAVVRRLCGAAALFCAAAAHALAAHVGDALGAHRPRRRQLHEHPDRQAVRPAARRGRIRARGDGRSDRRLPRAAAADHDAQADPRQLERDAGRRHRRSSRSGCGTTAASRSAPSRWRCR